MSVENAYQGVFTRGVLLEHEALTGWSLRTV